MKWEVVIPDYRVNDSRVAIYSDGGFYFEVATTDPTLSKAIAQQICDAHNRCDLCDGTGKRVPSYVNLSDPCPCQTK